MRLLLLPGLDGTGRLFDPFVRALPAELEATVVSHPADQALGYEALEARVPIPEEPFVLVGESFSGPIAMRIAASQPPRLRALVLVASFTKNPRPGLAWLAGLAGLAARVGPPDLALRQLLLGADASGEDVAALRASLSSVAPSVVARRFRAVVDVDEDASFDRIRVPMLYLAGKDDRVVPRQVAEALHRRRPDLRIVTLDAPHLVLQRRPAEAAREIRTFLRL